MDITSFYISLLEQFRTVRFAEQEFRRQMEDDPQMQEDYLLWCEENEFSPREGLSLFGTQYMEEREEKWNSLDDYDEMS